MSKGPAITRVIKVDDKTITIQISLTEDEIWRLLLPYLGEESERRYDREHGCYRTAYRGEGVNRSER